MRSKNNLQNLSIVKFDLRSLMMTEGTNTLFKDRRNTDVVI